MPFAVSPVVIGLSLVFVYGSRDGWFGPWLAEQGIEVIFTPVGMALATMFVSLPFVVREVIPVLEEIGDDQEQAASTLGAGGWQTFWRITLPSIRWGVTYGVILATARAMGEFGAVAVVSGRIWGPDRDGPAVCTQPLRPLQRVRRLRGRGRARRAGALVLVGMTLIQRRDDVSVAPSVISDAGGPAV